MASSICRRPGLSLAVRALAAAAALAGAGPSLAESGGADDAARSAARAKLVEGVEALRRSEHRLALEKFQAAYALVPSPKIHYDFGLAYVGLGRSADALRAFERFLAEAPDAPPDKREKAARQVEALRPQVRAAAVTAEDGRDGVAPRVDALQPDPARPVAGHVAPPAVEAVPAAPAPVGPAPPVADVSAPLSSARSAGGRTSDPRRVAALSLGAAGVVLIGAGLTFGALAGSESDSLSRDSAEGAITPRPFDPEKESRGMRYETLQVVSLAAGAVGLAAGLVVYASSRGRVTVQPAAPRALAGASVQVAF